MLSHSLVFLADLFGCFFRMYDTLKYEGQLRRLMGLAFCEDQVLWKLSSLYRHPGEYRSEVVYPRHGMSRTDEDSSISIHLAFPWINDSTFQTLERNQCVIIGAEVGYTTPIWHTAKKNVQ